MHSNYSPPFSPQAEQLSSDLERASISFEGSCDCLGRPLTNNAAAAASVKGGTAAAFELRLSAVPPLWPCCCAACMRLGLGRSRAVFGIDKRLDLATRTLLMRLPAVPDQGQLLRSLVSSSWGQLRRPITMPSQRLVSTDPAARRLAALFPS